MNPRGLPGALGIAGGALTGAAETASLTHPNPAALEPADGMLVGHVDVTFAIEAWVAIEAETPGRRVLGCGRRRIDRAPLPTGDRGLFAWDAIVAESGRLLFCFTAVSSASTAKRVGAFAPPAGSQEAVRLLSLAPGAYTAQPAGAGAATGVALVEVYEAR